MKTTDTHTPLWLVAARYVRHKLRQLRSAYSFFRQIKIGAYLRYGRKIAIYRKAHLKLHKTSRLILLGESGMRIGMPWDPLMPDTSLYPHGVDRFNPTFFDTHFVAGINAHAEIGDNFELISGSLIRIQQGGHLSTGKNFFMNSFSMIYCYDRVQIGDDVIIASYTQIRDSDGHPISYDGQVKKQTAPVIIHDHVWIASRVTILKGVTIGTGCVIAAGSVVTKSIPPRCLAAGNPARVIRENITWKR